MSLADIYFGFDVSPFAWGDELSLEQNIDGFESLLWRCRRYTSTAIGFSQQQPTDEFADQLRALSNHAMKLGNAMVEFYRQPSLYQRYREIAPVVPAYARGRYESNASAHSTMLSLLCVVLDRMANIVESKSDTPWPTFGFTEDDLFNLELETRKEFVLIREGKEVPPEDTDTTDNKAQQRPKATDVLEEDAKELLKGTRLKLFEKLFGRPHFTSFNTIAVWDDCFRSTPASDEAIVKSLNQIKAALLELRIEVDCSLADRRAKIYRQKTGT